MVQEEFFRKLYMETYYGLYHYVRSICKDKDAIEDILQETYYEACTHNNLLINHENPRGWLYKTASNKVRNYMKKCERSNVPLDSIIEIGVSERLFGEMEWKLALEKILSPEETDIFWKYYVLGFTGSEIAASLGISEGCLKVRMYRMKKKLRENLTDIH